VVFAGHGSDDGNIIAYNWRSTIDGFLSDFSSFNSAALSIGQHEIYLRVQDDDGVWSLEDFILLRINQIPTAIIDPISPHLANGGDIVGFYGYGNDDGYITAYNWSSDRDGFLNASDSFETSSLSLGEHVITFKVRDNDNTWSDGVQWTIRINKIPEAFIKSISPKTALSGKSVYFDGYGEDDVGIADYQWSSDRDGYLSNLDSFTWFGLSKGVHTIGFMVMDVDQIWSEEVYYEVKIHDAPTAKITGLSPESPDEDQFILFEGEGTDDGFIKKYQWTSSIDGDLSDEPEFTTKLSIGDHTISFMVMDDNDEWSRAVQRKLYVNSIPVAIIDSISPNPAVEGETVTLNGHGTDDDTIDAYRWTSSIDGIIGTESSVSISYLSLGTHDITFKVKDEDGVWSEEVFATLVVEIRTNLAPTVVFGSPANGEVVSDVIIIEAEAQDPEDYVDRIEIKVDDGDWFKISDSSSAYYSLDASDMASGKHVLYIRAYDGELYSAEEFILVQVDSGEDEGAYWLTDDFIMISLILVVIIIAVSIILLWFFVIRRRRGPQFIRL
ncbi:MAG: PKD domain-containing protein, partial [Methanomassiliicoccales archaeon]